jgi:uncharacterized repeat protein (TIGR01451 family)
MRRHRSRIISARRKSSYRPLIEVVEDRLLMAVITVTGTGDAINATDGMVTLREAITAANSNKNVSDVVGVGAYGADTIAFNIPGAGVRTIAPTSALPVITDPITIDGYTQPGSAPNTNSVGQGLNGTLLIEISGENAGDVPFGMIEIQTTDCLVRGLVINRTQGIKIGIDSVGAAGDVRIEGNYIGTDATGTAAFAADANPGFFDRHGITVASAGNTIGGTTPAARNLISGNVDKPGLSTAYGVFIRNGFPPAFQTLVQGNLIGTDRTGTKALGNGSGGVLDQVANPAAAPVVVGGLEAGAGNLISGNGGIGVRGFNAVVQGNFIGTDITGTLPIGNSVGAQANGNVLIAQNTIAFNTVSGVIDSGTGNLITRDAIFSNAGPGIGADAYQNDASDTDAIQNYPLLSSASVNGTGARVQGTLASKPSSSFRVEFFASSDREENVSDFVNGVFGEGRSYLGTINVTTDANGLVSFTADLPALPPGQPFVTATASDITDDGVGPRNNTSPFSPVVVLGGPAFVVTNTGDIGLGTLREAIFNANLTAGPQTITFAIPANDPGHFYYRNDGVSGQVSRAKVAVTAATSDATIADIDPDWPFSWYSIRPDRDLPKILETTVIDGYSQAGSRQNTLPALGPLDTVLRIELDGTNAQGIGLNVRHAGAAPDAANSRIDGLAISRFGGDGIQVSTLAGGVVIAGNFIGTDVSGLVDLGNGGNGVFLSEETHDTVGTDIPRDRNLISGNSKNGIFLVGPTGVLISGNIFGANRLLSAALLNDAAAIFEDAFAGVTEAIQASIFGAVTTVPAAIPARVPIDPDLDLQNQVYAGKPGLDPNLILENLIAQARVLRAAYEKANAAQIKEQKEQANEERRQAKGDVFVKDLEKAFDVSGRPALPEGNRSLAVTGPSLLFDLGDVGVQPNDGDNPLTPEIDPDSDTGPNGLQNYPVLAAAGSDATGTTITGVIDTLTQTNYRIEFYASSISPSVFRGGEQFLGFINVFTDASGHASFSFHSPISVPHDQYVLSTATRITLIAAGELLPIATSEFSDGVQVGAAVNQVTANLSVSQQIATPSPTPLGGDLTFTLNVANAGPDTATSVSLVVTPPLGATFVSATSGIVPTGGVLTFNLGALSRGASATVAYTVRPTVPGTFVGSAIVSSGVLDSSADDNATSTVAVAIDATAPTVSNVLLPNPKAKTTPLVLTFSEDLDLARASTLANYRLVTAGRDKKFGTKDDKVVALRSATYNSTTHTVTLLPRKKLTVSVAYRLTVNGTSASGVADRAGNLLDGDHDGRVSGNYVVAIKLKPVKNKPRH